MHENKESKIMNPDLFRETNQGKSVEEESFDSMRMLTSIILFGIIFWCIVIGLVYAAFSRWDNLESEQVVPVITDNKEK